MGRDDDGAATRDGALALMREDRQRLIAAVDAVAERGSGLPLGERWDRAFTN